MIVLRSLSVALLIALAAGGCKTRPDAGRAESFSFVVTSDMREFTAPKHPGLSYFEGVCRAIRDVGEGDFMISPGDIDPPAAVRQELDRAFGSNYVWYPVVGNHEAETPADMQWLRQWGEGAIPGLVDRGPAATESTTFSFDHGPAHFVILNQYFDGKADYRAKGDVADPLYNWLKEDLERTKKEVIIVVGHEPILPLPDIDNGRLRHEKDSLNAYPENSRRFHELLVENNVMAYLCAHTHNTSITNLNGVWQIDSGHARGKGDAGAPSTFLKLQVGRECFAEFYRDLERTGAYRMTRRVQLR